MTSISEELEDASETLRAIAEATSRAIDGAYPTHTPPDLVEAESATGALRRLGLLGVGVPEALGGSGGTIRHAGVVAEIAGAKLHAGPVLHAQVAALALAGSAPGAVVQQVMDTDAPVNVCFVSRTDEWWSVGVRVAFGALGAKLLLIGPDGVGRLFAARDLRPVEDDVWRSPDGSDALIALAPTWTTLAVSDRSQAIANGLAAMSIIGGVSALLSSTVSYVSVRRQFGVPIGSFQATKHSLARVYIECHHARALAVGALDALSVNDPGAARLALISKIAADGLVNGASRCLQAHGGIGYTWESRVHRYLKQALRLRQWPASHEALRASARKMVIGALRTST